MPSSIRSYAFGSDLDGMTQNMGGNETVWSCRHDAPSGDRTGDFARAGGCAGQITRTGIDLAAGVPLISSK